MTGANKAGIVLVKDSGGSMAGAVEGFEKERMSWLGVVGQVSVTRSSKSTTGKLHSSSWSASSVRELDGVDPKPPLERTREGRRIARETPCGLSFAGPSTRRLPRLTPFPVGYWQSRLRATHPEHAGRLLSQRDLRLTQVVQALDRGKGPSFRVRQ